ncbi:DUF6030 family protein [uncultured Hoeflea sp.]|uniref:DUF6030 family protein n=1 Tax=uncultured Hoeflea sp. TaxID=538666 RepID=UPI0030DD2461
MVLFVMIGGLASVVLFANDARNLERLLIRLGFAPVAQPSPVEIDVPPVAPAAKPPGPVIHVPERMLDSPLAALQDGFRRTITRRREDICSALQKNGWVGQQWQVAALGQRTWSCGAEKRVAGAGDPGAPAGSLFVSARGTGSDNVSSVRLKINFLDGKLSGPVLEQAIGAADDIFQAIGWGEEPAIIDNLRRLQVFEINGNGNTISLSREPTDIPRYNFLIVSDMPGPIRKGPASPARKRWLKSPEPAN